MASLEIELDVGRRTFRLSVRLAVGGETLAVVGPSGAGKTTLLRAIAGLEPGARGRIACGPRVWLDSERGIDLPPERRSVGLVFQGHALFPHMTVAQNVAFGSRRRAPELLRRLRIVHLAGARPGELSGGERQRVALARALAREPEVLLLDEPLSSLDTQTRAGVRAELRSLLAELRLPTLLVSHDFEDAAALAGRVAVLQDGQVRQVASAEELVARPADAFVGRLAGGYVLPGRARPLANGLTELRLEDGTAIVSTDSGSGLMGAVVYPWDVTLARSARVDSALNEIRAPVASLVPLGNRVRVRVGPVTAEVTAESARRLGLVEGRELVASFKAASTRLVPLEPPADAATGSAGA